jgi:hypothetical protein
MIVFAGLVGVTVACLGPQLANIAAKSRTVSLLIPGFLALFSYVLSYEITQGSIRNVVFPLLLIFLAGSIPAFVGVFWNKKITFIFLSLVFVVALGLGPAALFRLTERGRPIRVTVIKLLPSESADFKIVPQSGVDIEPSEVQMISGFHLRGVAVVVQTIEMGPEKGSTAHTVIILSQALSAPVSLAEGATSVAYVQDGSNWRKIPPDAVLSWRKIELYPISPQCTGVAVWRRIGRRITNQGPCWE